jgi:hypothetical protein
MIWVRVVDRPGWKVVVTVAMATSGPLLFATSNSGVAARE